MNCMSVVQETQARQELEVASSMKIQNFFRLVFNSLNVIYRCNLKNLVVSPFPIPPSPSTFCSTPFLPVQLVFELIHFKFTLQ